MIFPCWIWIRARRGPRRVLQDQYDKQKKINNVGLELKKCIHFRFNLSPSIKKISPSSQKNISIYQKKCILNIN